MKLLMISLAGWALLLPACKDPGEGSPAPSDVAGQASVEESDVAPLAGEAGTQVARPPAVETSSEAEASAPAPSSSGNPPAPEAPLQATRAEGVQALPGRPGFGVNPYTGGAIDMRGVPAGTVVRDPQDPDPAHFFRVSREIADGYAQGAKSGKEDRTPQSPKAPLLKDD